MMRPKIIWKYLDEYDEETMERIQTKVDEWVSAWVGCRIERMEEGGAQVSYQIWKPPSISPVNVLAALTCSDDVLVWICVGSEDHILGAYEGIKIGLMLKSHLDGDEGLSIEREGDI